MTAEELHSLATSLFDTNQGKRLEWLGVVRKVMRGIYDAANHQERDPNGGKYQRACAKATECVNKLASAHMSYITPMNERWFYFEPSGVQKDDSVKHFFAQCTDVAIDVLENSNCYTELIGVYIDRVATGTGLLLTEPVEEGVGINCVHVPAGTYAMEQDSRHRVNTVVRKLMMTPAQMADRFGLDALTPEVRKKVESPTSRYSEQVEVWHIVLPRKQSIAGVRDVAERDMPFASYYMEPGKKHILEESGYLEFPYMATRFTRYGNQVYGTSPLLAVEDSIDDLRVARETAKIAMQRACMPPTLVPTDMLGQMDYRAGAEIPVPIQYMNSALPREFAPVQNIPGIYDLREDYVSDIENALFIPVLEVVSRVDRAMTATEANYRDAERILTFTASFTQLKTDMRPFMTRLFNILLRQGAFPTEDAPMDLVSTFVAHNGEEYEMLNLEPQTMYIGKMSQGMKRAHMVGADVTMAKLMELSSVSQRPEYTAIVDAEKYAREMALANGMPAHLLVSPAKVKQMLAQVQAAQDQTRMAQDAVMLSQADKNRADANAALMGM